MTDRETEQQRRAAFAARCRSWLPNLPLSPPTAWRSSAADRLPGSHQTTRPAASAARSPSGVMVPPSSGAASPAIRRPSNDCIEAIHAAIPGRPVWNDATRRWQTAA